MVFPYVRVNRYGELRHLPYLPVRIHGPLASLPLTALADSGAEQSVFGLDVAQQIGLSLSESFPERMRGIGAEEFPGHLTLVKLQLGPHRWEAPAIFSETAYNRAILGQLGFFAYFNVTFRRARLDMDVRRVRTKRVELPTT